MAEAIFGLVGVIIGALVTGGVTYWMERRRERRVVRAAARLVQEEFMEGLMSAALVHLFEKNEIVTRAVTVTDNVWLEHRAKLAEALNGNEWAELTWAAKHRAEFGDWIQTRETIYADDLTLTKISNLYQWGNRGWDALSRAAGFSRRTRKRLKRAHERGVEETAPSEARDPAPADLPVSSP